MVLQSHAVSAMQGGNTNRFAEPEPDEFMGLMFQCGPIRFVGHQDDAAFLLSQELSHLLIQRHNAFPDIDDEQDQIGFRNSQVDLPFDVLGQIIMILDPVSPGIYQFKIMVVVVADRANPVSGDSRGRFDDTDTPTCQCVQP